MTEKDADPTKVVGQTATALGELMKLAADSEEGKEAAKNFGKSAIVLSEALNNCLLPIAAANFGIKKAKEYFQQKFSLDLEPLIAQIPPESIAEPKTSIAGPALQGLAFSLDEDELKSLYLNLIATAMDTRAASRAHPAYVEVIKQLTAREANSFSKLAAISRTDHPLVRVQKKIESGVTRVYGNVINWREIEPANNFPTEASVSMMDNWIRLGLITVDFTTWYTDPESYRWVETSAPYIILSHEGPDAKPEIFKGSMSITSFGRGFAEAVGIRARSVAIRINLGSVDAQGD